jgi:plasmid stabilization system protein ParE
MTAYVLTFAAREDLLRIGDHGLEEFGLEQALRFQDELEQTFRLLAAQPALGFVRTEYAPGSVRFLVRGPAVIAYSWERRPIEVLRVITGSLDLFA